MPTRPAYQSSQFASNAGTTTTITKPTGTVQGDLLVAVLSVRGTTGPTFTPPAGWTKLFDVNQGGAQFPSSSIFIKVAGAGEPASYAFTQPGATAAMGEISRITGADPANPVDSSSSNVQSGNSTSVAFNTISPTTNANLILLITSRAPVSAYSCTNVASFIQAYDDTVPTDVSHTTMAYGDSSSSGVATPAATQTSSTTSFGVALSIKPINTVSLSLFGAVFSLTGFATKNLIKVILSIFGSSPAAVITPAFIGKITPSWLFGSKSSEAWTFKDK